MTLELAPPTKLSVRLTILGLMLVPLFITPGLELWGRILSCSMPLIFTGTYRISKIVETRFETQFYFAFIPGPARTLDTIWKVRQGCFAVIQH